jgi:CheY-like chemotaxis protein
MRTRAISVGRRLAALVSVQVATAAVLIGVAFASYDRLASDLAFMHRYVLARIEGLSDAIEYAAQLKLAAEAAPETPPDVLLMKRWRHDVHLFLERYRNEWAVAENTSDDARLFHADLERVKQGELVTEEIIDDDADMRDLVRLVVEPTNVDVVEAATCVEGIAACRANRDRICLVLLDYFMPGMDPACCARQLCTLTGSAAIVLCTAGVNPAARAAEVGLSRWLAKPFELDALETLVRDAVRRHTPPLASQPATQEILECPRGSG